MKAEISESYKFILKRKVELELIYSPLKDLRDTRAFPLGSLEKIYQEVREEYLNRDN